MLGQDLAHERQVFLEDLLLEGMGGRRDDDLSTGEDRRDEVREGLSRPRPRLDEEVTVTVERVMDRSGHGELAVTLLVTGKAPRQWRARAEDVVDRQAARTRFRRLLHHETLGHRRIVGIDAARVGIGRRTAHGDSSSEPGRERRASPAGSLGLSPARAIVVRSDP